MPKNNRWVASIMPATAAGATTAGVQVPTPDDNVARRLKRVIPTNTAKGVRIVIRNAGAQVAVIDCGVFATNPRPLELDETFQGGVIITYDVVAQFATAVALNTDEVLFEYDLPGG